MISSLELHVTQLHKTNIWLYINQNIYLHHSAIKYFPIAAATRQITDLYNALLQIWYCSYGNNIHRNLYNSKQKVFKNACNSINI